MNRLKLLSVTFLALLVASPRVSHSQTTVNSDPVGFVTTTIRPGTVTGFTPTMVSPVLNSPADISVGLAGSLSSVSSNSLTVATGGWSNNALSASHSYLMLTDGPQKGLILRVTGNTSNTVTVQTFGLNLASTGIASGNNYKLLGGDTLRNFFGAPTNGVLGGTAAENSNRLVDQVSAVDASGSLRTFYFDTAFGQWRRPGTSANQDNTPIPPISGVLYNRRAQTPLTYVQPGYVPTHEVRYIVPGSGTVFLGRYFPTDGTISSLGLQNLTGWTINDDKFVTVDALGALRTYFWNGTQWRRSGTSSNQGNVPLPAGGAGYTLRSGKTPQILSVDLPYTL